MRKKVIITEAQAKKIVSLINESFEPSEIGEITCCLEDDDCYYVEFFDSETYHLCGHDTMTIEEIEDMFGAQLAADVYKECADGKEHRYEPMAYDNEVINLNNPRDLSNAAMKRLQHGEYTKNCRGFILPNGVVVYTGAEHNMCSQIPGVKGTFHFIELGCIRVLDHSIDLACKPTLEQWETLNNLLDDYYGETLYLDLMNKQIGNVSKTYEELYPDEVIEDINSYFSNGFVKKRQTYRELYESVDEKTLYHGTNNNFDQFKEEFYLSGVGKMDFGYGVYLTSSINTAKAYGPGGTIMVVDVPDGKYLNGDKVTKAEAMSIARKFYKYYLSTDYGKSAYQGFEREFWDQECSCIGKCGDGNYVYGSISSFLGSDQEASQWLRSIGYIGLTYNCENRETGERFTNYVIFNPSDIKIIEKRKSD